MAKDDFDTHLKRVQETSSLPCTTSADFFKGLMEIYEYDTEKLAEATGFGDELISDLRRPKANPSRKSILAACIAMGVPICDTEKLLMLAGCGFKAGCTLHDYYKTLAIYYTGHSIEECNGYLKLKGVRRCDWLEPKKPKEKGQAE